MPVTSLARSRTLWSTPLRLVVWMAAIAALAGVAGGVALWTAGRIHDAAQTIGRDAEPSVALALRMAATLGDLDADAVSDSLFDRGATIGTSARFRADLDSLGSDLIAATRNITYGDAEAVPIRNLQQQIPLYEEAIVEARDLDPASPWITSRRVQWASRVNREFAVPEAEALAAANADQLEQHYASYCATALADGVAGFAAFAVLAAALLGVQVWLARRMRRIVNPALAAATVLCGLAGLWFGAAVLTERADLRAAKADAYDSLHVLFEAKSATNTLRAGMSLWLLDASIRADTEEQMATAAHALIGPDLTQPDQLGPVSEALNQALYDEKDGHPGQALRDAPQTRGLLGAELNNVTFGMPERQAATDSVLRLADAERIIGLVQATELQGDHEPAVVRWLDERPEGGAAAFRALQAALDRTIAVNQSEFDRRVAASLSTAALIPLVSGGALVLVALLSIVGLWLRLREYR